MLEENNFYVSSANRPSINIPALCAHRAAEEYADAEDLSSGTIVVVDGVGEFNVIKIGENYVSCQK